MRGFSEFEACREHEAQHPKFKGIQKEMSDPDHPEQLPEVLWLKFGENGMIGIYELNRLDRVCELGIPAFDRDDFFEKYGEGETEHGAVTCSVFPDERPVSMKLGCLDCKDDYPDTYELHRGPIGAER